MFQTFVRNLARGTSTAQRGVTPTVLRAAKASTPDTEASLKFAEELEEANQDSPVRQTEDKRQSEKKKIGSRSPWESFDAWGANKMPSDERLANIEEDIAMLSEEALAVGPDSDTDSNEESVSACLQAYDRILASKSSVHFGYPYNLRYNHEELYPFLKYSINNLGDPFVTSNYGVHSREFEQAVVAFFAKLWKLPERDDYWGYVTTCGTEGNLHGILLAREVLPDGILYSSKESHYSIFKAARYYRMTAQAINSMPSGEIDYFELEERLRENMDKPAIINVNVGTTVKGAVDNLDRILRILSTLKFPRERFYIHCDGALFALMLPFVQYAPQINFEKPIDSIAVSGHKMLGCPMPCGVVVTRRKHVEQVEQRIEYLNSVDTTIMGSRNGQAPLFLWYSLKRKGMAGIKRDVQHCMETAVYLRDELVNVGIVAQLNDLSCTVCMERPVDDALVKRWQLACEVDIAHVVVMPNITREKIDIFVKEFADSRKKYGAMDRAEKGSNLDLLRKVPW